MLPLILGAAGSILGDVLGGVFGGADRSKAEALFKEAMAEVNAVGGPPDLAHEIVLNKFKQAGLWKPELEEAIKQQVSNVAGIKEDAGLRDMQKSVLEDLARRGKGGLGAEDRAAYNQMRQQVQQDTEAKRQQIMQNAAARGTAGAGGELAAQLMAAQSGADTASAQGDRISADASRRALEAMTSSGQMAGQLRGQDFDIANTKASAADEMDRFNVMNSIERQRANVQRQNDAARYNLDSEQDISNRNTGQSNAELYRQADAKRQFWADKSARAQQVADAKSNMAGHYDKKAAQTSQTFHNVGAAAGSVGAAVYGANQKEADREFERKEREKDRLAKGSSTDGRDGRFRW